MDVVDAIAHMRGPEFLVLYSIVCLITLVVAVLWSRRCDALPVFAKPPADPSVSSDPYAFAWLRDGARGVVATALFTLRQVGLIKVTSGGVEQTAPPQGLDDVQRVVFSSVAGRPSLGSVMKDRGLRGMIDQISQRYVGQYAAAGLVTTPSERTRSLVAIFGGLAVVLGLATFKLVVALQTGHRNVGFLVLLALLASIVIAVACRPRRLNSRGRAYLREMRKTYATWGTTIAQTANASMLPLYVGLIGTSVLAGTEYDDLNRGLQAARSASGGSCGSGGGCSSGSSDSGGGGSCGGGGGCGGGGCGGCGGG